MGSRSILGLERAPAGTGDAARIRSRVMGLLMACVFLLVILRLVELQLVRGPEFRTRSLDNLIQVKRIDHMRGDIVDREGRVLVSNRPAINVYVTPAFFPNARGLLRRLAREVGLGETAFEGVSQALSKAVFEDGPPLLLARDLRYEDAQRLRQLQADLDLPLDALIVIEMGPPKDGLLAAYIDPQVFPSTGGVLRQLRSVMGRTPEQMADLERKVRYARGLERCVEVLVERDISPEVEAHLALRIQLGDLSGVSVRRSNTRAYPNEALAAHVLGYVNEISPRELSLRRDLGYRSGDTLGRWGVERAFEDELRGLDGREVDVVDSKGRVVHSPFARELRREVGGVRPPTPGDRVVLALDLDMQRAAETAFQGQAGAVVLMDAYSGELLALTSTPTFNPSRVSGRLQPEERRRLDALKVFRPWRFRAIQDHFAPGSTFKVITALAALEVRKAGPYETVYCPGSYTLGRTRFRCWKDQGHGDMDLRHAIAKSCDVYFYQLGSRLGLDPIVHTARAWGFGDKTGVDFFDESSGILPDRVWCRNHRRRGCSLGDAVNASIGQGAISVTPLQLAVAYAAIANGGRVLVPKIAKRVEARDRKRVRHIEAELRREVPVDARVLKPVQEGLRNVVNAPHGTAFYRRSKLFAISGKTGTAQVKKLGKRRIRNKEMVWKDRDHAWFAAYAPADDPQVVVVVFVEHGGGGSSAAAPIAVTLLEAWYKKYATTP